MVWKGTLGLGYLWYLLSSQGHKGEVRPLVTGEKDRFIPGVFLCGVSGVPWVVLEVQRILGQRERERVGEGESGGKTDSGCASSTLPLEKSFCLGKT